MILRGENRSARRKTGLIANLSSTNPIPSGLGSNTGISDEKPVTGRLNHDTVGHRAVWQKRTDVSENRTAPRKR